MGVTKTRRFTKILTISKGMNLNKQLVFFIYYIKGAIFSASSCGTGRRDHVHCLNVKCRLST